MPEFHDAVYDRRPGDDEEASALLAETALRELGLPAARVAEVARLIRLTATHDPVPGVFRTPRARELWEAAAQANVAAELARLADPLILLDGDEAE